MKDFSGIEFASEHNGTDVFRLIELAYEQGQKDGHSEQLGTNLAEVGTDAISRDAVKELLNNNGLPYHINPVLWKELNDLPPAQPKIGRWIHDGSKWTNRWICSECGYKWFFDCIEGAYCPNCGSDMRGEKDG